MGLLTVSASNLISLNAGGLEKTLEQILEALQKQDAALKEQEEVLQAQSLRLDGIEGGSLALATSGEPAASNAALDLTGLEATIEELSRRLTFSEESQGEWSRRLLAVEQERGHRESLEKCVRSLEASQRATQESTLSAGNGFNRELQELRDTLYEELRRRCQAFESRVRVAEEKASECRRQAKAYRDTVDEREFSASEVQKTLRTIENSTKQALESSGQAMDVQKEATLLTRSFESQFQELESRLEQKVNDSVVDAMRSDLEMNGRVLQDAVKAVGQRLSAQEERLHTLEMTRQRSASVELRRRLGQDGRDRENAWREGAQEREESSHCLLCSNDRSTSPTTVLIGTDNTVYGHADPMPENSCGPPSLAGLRASLTRPRATVPSMRQGSPQVILSSSWEALPGRTAATSASTSSIQKGCVRRGGSDVRSKRIGDLVAYPKVEPDSRTSSRPSSATFPKTQTPSTRPSSAQSRGIRPSSAGAYRASPALEALSASSPSAGDLMLVASQSLPLLEKRSDGAETF